jgi:hypothetical protein
MREGEREREGERRRRRICPLVELEFHQQCQHKESESNIILTQHFCDRTFGGMILLISPSQCVRLSSPLHLLVSQT